jgi:hypothetical protein
MGLTLRENCERRLAGMKTQRKPYETDWQEIARLVMPTRSDILAISNGTTVPKPSKSRANNALHSSKGRRAARILTAGMTSGLSSPSRPWFKLKTPYPEMNEYQPIKEWLAEVEGLTYDFLAGTNFYNAVKVGYAELGCFGTEAGVMVDDPYYGMVTHALTAGEYWIANDRGLIADTLYRRVFLTVRNLVENFVRQRGWGVVSKAVKNAWDNSNYETIVPVMHAIEPRDFRDATKIDVKNKAYASLWWEEGQSSKDVLLRESGFDEKPFYAPRWVETGGEVIYGDGPGYDALPDLRNLQLAAKRRGRNIDRLDRPPMGAPIGLANTFLTLDPGTITFGSALDIQATGPIYTPDPRLVQFFREEEDDLANNVAEAFYADLFFAITEMEGVQPRNTEELFLRNEEKLTQLGPVVERVNVEKLEVVVDRAFAILMRYGQLPPAPKELQGQPLRVDFISTLAQVQKAARLGDIQKTAQFVGYLGGANPEAFDKFDFDQAIDEFATGAGTPPSIIRTDEVVAKMRADRAQQQNMAAAAAAMPAAREGAAAAELLSRTNVGGQNMLERMIGA